MSKFSLKVKVTSIGDTKVFGTGDFKKRELVGEITENGYTNPFVFEFVNDKTALLDEILPNTDVTVHFNIRCRKVEQPGKEPMYFTSLNGWKIDI